MTNSGTVLITLAAEFLFAVIFLRAFTLYLRGRDPLQRSLTLVFMPITLLFVAGIVRELGGQVPAVVSILATVLLVAQPYFTLRLAGRLRTVPRWLDRTLLAAYLAAAAPMLLAPRPLPRWVLLLAVGVFVVSELVAAGFLAAEARTRTGSSRARLWIATGSTVIVAAAITALGAAATRPDTGATLASRILALLAGLGYCVAFVPPLWLRRTWSANASLAITERLLRAPSTSADEVWQTYAEQVRLHTAADAVAVLVRRDTGQLVQTAYSGTPVEPPTGFSVDDLEVLTAARQPVSLSPPPGPSGRRGLPVPALAAHYGQQIGAGFVTALAIRVLPEATGAVLMLTRHRSLFTDDDLRLLADLGGQAGILAEREAVTTEQRRLAARLTDSVTALTRANEAKSDFLANMSHELRTPLNAIIGFSDLMRQEEPDDDRRSVPADWVDHIHSSGRHLLGLINDILDLAKVEAGKLELHPVAMRVDTAAVETVTGLRPLIDRKNLQVQVRMPELTALADPVRFRQILENLLSNAIKFTPPDGRITVTGALDGDAATLTVTDTGVGIAEADLERVFHEFQQVGDPSQHRAGTGLGLALTRRLVQAHGGDIALRSQVGTGSAFTVRLPAAPAAPAPAATVAPSSDTAGSHGRVLVIDDDARAAELLRTHLAAAGYRVDVAATGELGFTSAAADPPDAILLDVELPGINGWEVIRRLKSEPALAGIPVLFASVVDDRQAGLSLGAADYFVKPLDHGSLLGALARHIMTASPGKPAGRLDAPRVLLVEHDETARGAVAHNLRTAGADVVACADGREGLRLCRERRFDLIVCDLQRPDVDGFSLLAAIDHDPATRNTPVVGLTPASTIGTTLVTTSAIGGEGGWDRVLSLAARAAGSSSGDAHD